MKCQAFEDDTFVCAVCGIELETFDNIICEDCDREQTADDMAAEQYENDAYGCDAAT